MLNNSELALLLDAMRTSRVTSLEVNSRAQRLRLVLPSPTAQSTTTPTAMQPVEALPEAERFCADSPSIGTFLRRGIDDGLALLEPGMHVAKGEILGYVCHGPVRLAIDAPLSSTVIDEGPSDGAALGFGDTVFNLEVTS